MGKFKPAPPGPWTPYRFAIMDKIGQLHLQPGDIAVRMGNAVTSPQLVDLLEIGAMASESLGLGSLIKLLKKTGITEALVRIDLPFSRMIAAITGSKYSHAAQVIEGGDDPLLLNVGPRGVTREFFRDWIDEVRSDDVLFLRYTGEDSDTVLKQVSQFLKNEVLRDADYNSDFNQSTDTLYCVQLPYMVFKEAGVVLTPPTRFIDLPNWSLMADLVALIGDINPNNEIYFVGDSKAGLLSSSKLKTCGRVTVENGQAVCQCFT